MRKALLSMLFTAVAFCGSTAPANAGIGWWDYLEQLSGPGHFWFKGFILDGTVACRFADSDDKNGTWVPISLKDRSCFLEPTKKRGDNKTAKEYFSVRYGFMRSWADEPLFEDRPNEITQGHVTVQVVEGLFMWQANAALAVGAGGGWIRLSGDQVVDANGATTVVSRPTVKLVSIAFTPIGVTHLITPAARDAWITFRFEETAILKGLTAKEFNTASTSSFLTDKTDLVGSMSVVFDLRSLIKKWN